MSRILLVANYPSDEGYAWWLMESYWVTIAKWAASQGRGCVLCYPKITTIPATIRDAPIETVEMAFDPATRSGRLALRDLIRSRGIESVYLTDHALLSMHYAWLRLQGIRHIVIHDHTPGERRPARGLRKLLKSSMHQLRIFSATRYLAVSNFVRDRIIRTWCVIPEHSVAVENGIPIGLGSPDRRSELRREFGLSDDEIVVLSVSRATRYKGVDFMLEVAHCLRRRGVRGITLIHCGDGPDLEDFRANVRERNLEDAFILAGHRSDARDMMHCADIAIHASRGEAHCLAILEYMDAALPVVVPDLRSVCQDVVDGENGLVYEAEDAERAADALERLSRNPLERARLGANGRALVRERFTIGAANDRLRLAIEGHL